jgi:hypothetical protein
VTLHLACGADGNGFVGMALAGTRKDFEDFEDLLLELVELDSRDIRSRTICGMSTRWVNVTVLTVWPFRCFLSFVRCGDGDRGMSITLSFFERAGLNGGVCVDSSIVGDESIRDGARTA